jgi:hypothetical protein
MALLGAVYCQTELSRGRRFGAGLIGFVALSFLAKGFLGVLGLPVLVAAWWHQRPRTSLAPRCWLGAALGVALLAVAYEAWFWSRTQQSFFQLYLSAQGAHVARDEQRGLLQKLATTPYYLVNLLWFAIPGSLLSVLEAVRTLRSKAPASVMQKLTGTSIVCCVLALAPLTRRAARYVFPVYPLVQILGAITAARLFPGLRGRLERRGGRLPWLLMIALLSLVAGRVYFDARFYSNINPLHAPTQPGR